MTTLATTLTARRSNLVVVAAVALAPLAVAFVRLVPPEGEGLALRLAVAGACVFLLPGALIVRALGAPTELSLAAAAALAWSLVAVFLALLATFVLNRSLTFTLSVFGVIVLLSFVGALWKGRGEAPGRADLVTVLGLVAGGLVVGAVVWWAAPPIQGDALEHLGRARKLDEMPRLESFRVSEFYRDGDPHPGYAFPLWHGALALVARLADVDTALVVRGLPALLTPLAFVLVYAVGATLFRSRWGGLAVLAGQFAFFALPPRGGAGLGVLETLTGPAHASVLLLAPAILALTFAFIERGERVLLASVGAAAFAFAVVHPSYAPYIALVLGGFAIARFLLAPDERLDAARSGLALGAVLVPAGLFLVWLLPTVTATEGVTPDAADERRYIAWYASQLDFVGDSFRYGPHAIATNGPVAVAGLLAVPFAFLARRSQWAAFVLGTAVPILAILLVPPFFMLLADLATLSQARRLAIFLPLSFAFAGAAVMLGRLRFVGVAVALTLGVVLQLVYPGDFTYGLEAGGGPSWSVWVAALGGAAVFVVAVALRRRGGKPQEPSRWTAFVALAFVSPVVALTLPSMPRPEHTDSLSPGLVKALRTEVTPGEVVFANGRISYRALAYAPIYAVASDHAWDRPYERIRDVERFFASGAGGTSDVNRRRLLAKYGATWVIVDKTKSAPRRFLSSLQRVHVDRRYVLYRVPIASRR